MEDAAERMLSTAAMRAALLHGLEDAMREVLTDETITKAIVVHWNGKGNIGMSIMGADCGDVVLAAALLQERALRAFGLTDTDMKEEWADDTGDD